MKYTLYTGEIVESIPIGKSSVVPGEKSFNNQFEIIDRITGINKKNRTAWVVCKCNCGNYFTSTINSIRAKQVKSCGCLNSAIFKEKGKLVGNLPKKTKDYSNGYNPYYSFVEKTEEKTKDGFIWNVKCKSCGKIYKAVPSQLISQTRPKGNNPCPCWKKESKGVALIKILLESHSISYEVEKTFPTCLSPKGNLMKFDFYIDNKYLIEFDGEQHFLPQKFNTNVDGDEKLKLQQEYDEIKNNWCKENSITLIRIPYAHIPQLNIEDLKENSKFKI